MPHILPSQDIRPLNRLGGQAAKLLKEARRNRRPVFLTNKGEAAGVLMDVQEYERLMESIAFHETILASEAEADRGEVISHEQLEKESKRWVKQARRQTSTKSNGQKNGATLAEPDRQLHSEGQTTGCGKFSPSHLSESSLAKEFSSIRPNRTGVWQPHAARVAPR